MPVALLHVDTHADVSDEMFEDRKTHGEVVRAYVKNTLSFFKSTINFP